MVSGTPDPRGRADAMKERLSRLGARLGNWNDRRHGGDSRGEHAPPHGVIDRLAGWLYTLPERRRLRSRLRSRMPHRYLVWSYMRALRKAMKDMEAGR